MIPDWDTNTVLFADLLPRRFSELFRRLSALLKARKIPHALVKGSKDVWLRDYAPTQSGSGRFVQFCYRPDYLKGYADFITAPRVFKRLTFLTKVHKSRLIIDGGNLVSDGTVAVLTEKVFRENPDRRRREIERELKSKLAVKRLVFIPQEPADPIGHSDGMVRFIRKSQVIINNYSEFDRNFDAELASALTKQDLAIVRFPYVPSGGPGTGIPPAIGNYVNFLRVGSLIVMPKYGLPQDRTASMRIAGLIPDAEVISVASRELAQEGGMLHCATWTVRTNAID